MSHRKLWEIGGFVAGGVLIVFGIVAIFLGVNGFIDDPRLDQGRGDHVRHGRRSGRCEVRRAVGRRASRDRRPGALLRPVHARSRARVDGRADLRADGALPVGEDPDDPAGTSEPTEAAKADGQPISNAARDIWITETALTTALNVCYMAERLAVFGIVVGVALLLTGIGLVILAFAVFGRARAGDGSCICEDAGHGLIRETGRSPDRKSSDLPECQGAAQAAPSACVVFRGRNRVDRGGT